MKAGIARRGAWNEGRWAARARWREDSRLLILDVVDVWDVEGQFVWRVRAVTAVADARAIDRAARHIAERALRHQSAMLHAAGSDNVQAA